MKNIPAFQTERLILKGLTLNDVPAYEKYFVDYEVIRFFSKAVPWPYPENGVRDFIKEHILPIQGNNKWVWGIFLKDNPDELIGSISLWRKGIPENRGFWLAKKFWGKGIMTEAVHPVIDYAFNSLGFEKLIFTNAVGNHASRKIKEKTGCKFIGVEPSQYVDPQFTEHELWELTKTAWEKYRSFNPVD